MNIKKLKLNITKTIIYSIVALIIIGASVYIISFLYNNFYRSLSSSQEVKVFQGGWEVETSNIRRFQEVKEQLKRKSKNRKENNIFMDFN